MVPTVVFFVCVVGACVCVVEWGGRGRGRSRVRLSHHRSFACVNALTFVSMCECASVCASAYYNEYSICILCAHTHTHRQQRTHAHTPSQHTFYNGTNALLVRAKFAAHRHTHTHRHQLTHMQTHTHTLGWLLAMMMPRWWLG